LRVSIALCSLRVSIPLCSLHCICFTVFNLTLLTKNVPLQVCRMYIWSCGVLVSRPAGRRDRLMWKLCKLLRLQCSSLRNLLEVGKYSVCRRASF
jgi:hypothetical protein